MNNVTAFSEATCANGPLPCPLFTSSVRAGFPSPADDWLEQPIDLNEHLVRRPAATFFAHAEGDSMEGYGISDGDLLIVDRSLNLRHGRVAIFCVDGDLTVKCFEKFPVPRLVSSSPSYPPILLDNGDVQCWGVVTHVVHALPGAKAQQ
ncbi:translesion error-prone DNA polymerase V autoproteolytic subunit [Halomonas sp. 86]|uniref:translesion error-prone DNA polymerase V autoproteolytic subunit n=1 Tax=unclassified Halomonas TaxID=2609666 RepID=UPI004034225E